MSGLLFRYLLLIAAAAMSGITAFNVVPAEHPLPRSPAMSPEPVVGSAIGPQSPAGPFVPHRGPVELPGIADKRLMRSLADVMTPEVGEVTLAFSGDILIHGNVRNRAALGDDRYDFRPMFEDVKSLIQSADLAICHLEVPLTSTNSDLSTYPRFNAPHEVAEAIAYAGFDGCSTASNHAFDKGVDGLSDTLDILDRAGVGHAGTARTETEAESATFYEIDGGPTVAHIAATYWLNGLQTPEGQDWMAQRIDIDRILEVASSARRSGADLVVVSIHCCTEYRTEPTPQQVEIFDALIRNGWVDLVVGHHSHLVGPAAEIGDEFVFYGLGNLLSGQLHRTDTREGVLAFATARWTGARWRFTGLSAVPTWVESGSYSVVPVSEETESFERTMGVLGSYGVVMERYQPD